MEANTVAPARVALFLHPAPRMADLRFLVFGGSLRKNSLNDRLAGLAADAVERNGGAVERACMRDFDCPSYDYDLEAAKAFPLGATRLRDALCRVDGLILSSPEFNASMPGCLKNAIDWVSRFSPQPFMRRQALLMSASPSMVGGNRGLWSLRVPLEHLGARVYPDMFSLAQAHQAFGADGQIADPTLRSRFESTINCFMDLVEAAKHYPAMKSQWVEFLGERTTAETERVEQAA